MDTEQTLNSIIFFPSVKNGSYDYSTPLMNIEKFDTDKSNECSQTLFEYLCYKIVKKKLLEGKINSDTVLITDQFLSTYNCKQLFIKTNAIHKKHIIIFLRNQISQKWNLITFLDLEKQLKTCFDQVNKKPITAKIISSSQNSDEDDYILNSTMDKLENTFNFKSPDDIQFEVDSINISDQPNTSIFLLNFIEGLMSQIDDENLLLYIKKLYDEGSNNIDQSSKDYFNSFNRLNEEFENICTKYKKELNEYKNINGIKFDGEKIMNGSNEILNVAISNGLTMGECKNGQGEIVNGMNTVNLNNENNKMKDDIDMIQIEQDDELDDELNSEEEEEALKIMERENKVAKSQMREQERKLRQRMYKQKLRLKNINMYKEFGVIKEEDNESESESIDYFSKIKEEEAKNKEAIIDIKKSLRKSMETRKNRNDSKNNGNNNIQNNENMVVLNTENNINKNIELKKDLLNSENTQTETDQKCKSEKRIKLSVLKDLEEAIEEFESEQDPIKPLDGNSSNNNSHINNSSSNNNSNNNSNININNNNTNLNNNKNIEKENKKIQMTNENKETKDENKEVKENKSKIEKKFSIKSNVEENKKYNKKNSSKNNNYIKKESIDLNLTKKGSIPKGKVKEKEQPQENKDKVLLINKIIENPKKPFIGDSKTQEKDKDKKKEKEKEKEKTKEKKPDESLNKIIKNNNRKTSKSKNQNNNSVKNNKSINTISSKNSKDQDNSSTNNNSTSNILNKDSFKSYNSSNNSKNMNDSEKSSNKEKEKENIKINLEPSNNTVKKSGNINANNNIKKKNSKNLKKSNSKRTSKEINNSNSNIPISPKMTTESKQTSSSLKTEVTVRSYRNSMENKNLKEIVEKNSKNINDFIVIESKNGLEPDKLVKRNGNDLKSKERVENGSKKIINLDLNSLHSERYYGDCSSNINIENISDDFESESSKNKKYEYNEGGSFYGENRTKKTTYKRGDKKMKIPPGKSRTNHINYTNQFCNYDEEGNSKPCGCIGEQANALCFIF